MRRLGDQRGQAAAVVVLLIPVLVAMAAIAIDVGAWYVAKRSVQNAADAAALAGAARLPNGTPAAQTAATAAYAANAGSGDATSYAFPRYDTISVTASRTVDGFFSRVLGISSATVQAHAEATIFSYTRVENDFDLLPWGVMRASFVPGQQYAIYTDSSSANNGALSLPTVSGSGCATTGGGDDYRMNLAGDTVACPLSIGDIVDTKTGSMAGPTSQGLTARVGGGFQPVSAIVRFDPDGGATILDEDSPQLVKLPIVENLDGTTVWPSGSGNVRVVGFAYFAISGMSSDGKEVYGVFVRAQSPPGTGNGTTGAWNPASTLYTVQLTL